MQKHVLSKIIDLKIRQRINCTAQKDMKTNNIEAVGRIIA